MKFRYPSYYDRFTCIAGRCEDTCCAGWEIDIDDASYEFYMGIEGDFGRELRNNIKEYEREEDVYERHGFILKDKRRCPFLNKDNLCVIYQKLGEEALCDVCTDTPRNYLEYGGAREMALSASCPEAGRLIYGSEEPITFTEKEIEEKLDFQESDEELVLAEEIRWARDQAICILQNRQIPVEERICAYLVFAEEVQKRLNEDAIVDIHKIKIAPYFHWSTSVDKKKNGEEMTFFLQRMKSFTGLESISEEWEDVLGLLQKRYVEPVDGASRYRKEREAFDRELKRQGREYEKEHLMVYYSFLCLARCIDDYDFLGKAKLVVTSFLMIRDMDTVWFSEHEGIYTREDRVKLARIYAKEVEHSENNMEYLADEFIFEAAYTPENLRVSLTIE